MATKIGHYVDANGLFVGDVLDDSPTDETLTLVTDDVPEGFHHPKWNGTQWVEGKSDADLLEVAKQSKLVELEASYNQTLSSFTSSALGTPHTYACGQDEKGRDYMTLFNAQFAYIMSVYYNNSPILWFTVEVGDIYHTKDEFVIVYQDGMAHVGGARLKRNQFTANIENAMTLDELNAVTFSW